MGLMFGGIMFVPRSALAIHLLIHAESMFFKLVVSQKNARYFVVYNFSPDPFPCNLPLSLTD